MTDHQSPTVRLRLRLSLRVMPITFANPRKIRPTLATDVVLVWAYASNAG
jgi:hypothetical protein